MSRVGFDAGSLEGSVVTCNFPVPLARCVGGLVSLHVLGSEQPVQLPLMLGRPAHARARRCPKSPGTSVAAGRRPFFMPHRDIVTFLQ